MKLLDFLNKNKECWDDFEGGIKNIKNITDTRRDIFEHLDFNTVGQLFNRYDVKDLSKLIEIHIPDENKDKFNFIFNNNNDNNNLKILQLHIKAQIEAKNEADSTQQGKKIFTPLIREFIEETMKFLSEDAISALHEQYKTIQIHKGFLYNLISSSGINIKLGKDENFDMFNNVCKVGIQTKVDEKRFESISYQLNDSVIIINNGQSNITHDYRSSYY